MTLPGMLVLNGLNLLMDAPTADGYQINALGDDFEIGSPEAVIAHVASQLMDGDMERVDRFGNRTITVPVRVAAPTTADASVGAVLDAGATALEQACTWIGFALLSLMPPSGGSAQRDYVAWTAVPEWKYSDLDDLKHEVRYYTVTVSARPFARASTLTSFNAPSLPGSGTPPPTVVTADGTSAATFTVSAGVANPPAGGSASAISGPTSTSGVVRGSATFNTPPSQPSMGVSLTHTPATVLTSYAGGTVTVVSTYKASASRSVTRLIFINGVRVYQSELFTSTTTEVSYTDIVPIPSEGLTSVAVMMSTGGATTNLVMTVGVDSITVAPTPVPSAAVQSRQIVIGGTQRADLSLTVLGLDSAGTTSVALGSQTLVATGPAGRTSFVQVRAAATSISAAGTVDSTMLSGARNALSTAALTFTIANAKLLTGTYAAFARIRSTTTGTKTLRITSEILSVDASFDTATVPTWPQVGTNAWTIVPLGVIEIAENGVAPTTQTLSISLPSGASVDLDDVYLCEIGTDGSRGQVSLIDTSASQVSGGASSLELVAATASSAVQKVYVGTADGATRVECLPTLVQALDQHAGIPGSLQVSTITPNCTTSRVSATYYATRLL